MRALKATNHLPLSAQIIACRYAAFFLLSLTLVAQLPRPLRASEETASFANEPVEVSLPDLPTEVVLGEPFRLQVRAIWENPAIQVDLELPDTHGSPLRFLSQVHKKQIRSDGKSVCLFGLDAVMLDMGKQTIPSLSIAYGDGRGILHRVHTKPSTLSVTSYLETLPIQGEIASKPPAPPIVWPISRWVWAFLSLAGGVLLALAAYLLWRIRRSHGLPQILAQAAPVLPPDEEALRALSEIELSGLVLRQEAKAYYTRLSEILRRYIARRFRLDALEMTSMELLETMHRLKLPPNTIDALHHDLAESDSVKFARFTPSTSSREEALRRVRQIVIETRIVEQERSDSETGAMLNHPMSGASS